MKALENMPSMNALASRAELTEISATALSLKLLIKPGMMRKKEDPMLTRRSKF